MKAPGRRLRPTWLSLSFLLLLTLAIPPPAAHAAPAAQTENFQTTPAHTIYIPPPEGAVQFGAAIDYDGETLVVGAPRTTVGEDGMYQGMVYIYALDADAPENWALQASITLTTPNEFAYFGESVAVDGDIIVAGAPGADDPVNNNGGVLFIERTADDPTWRPTHYERNIEYHPVDGNLIMGSSAEFGTSVAIEEGVVLIGAPDADVFHPDSGRLSSRGAAYLYTRSEQVGDWSKVGEFSNLEGRNIDDFGASVALDLQGDTHYVVVGSPRGSVHEDYDQCGKAFVWKK